MLNVLIVEDIVETALWIKERVERVFAESNVTLCHSIEDACNKIKTDCFLIALIDINLPDGSGLSLIETFKRLQEEATVVTVTIYDDDEHVFDAIRSGADGYLLKDLPAEQFEKKLEDVFRGEPALSPSIARKIMKSFSVTSEPIQSNAPKTRLTHRELEVLTLLAKGLTRTEVAELLSLSPNTIAKYIKDIYRKLGVSSRAEMAVQACGMGLVTNE